MGDRGSNQVKANVLAMQHAGTEYAHKRVFDDWTHWFRQKGAQILVDSNSGHGGLECFRLEMISEEAAIEAYDRIAEAEEDAKVDIRDLQPKHMPMD